MSANPSITDLEIYTDGMLHGMLQGIPITFPPSFSTQALLVTAVISHTSNVWFSTRDIEFGVDVSPLFCSIMLLDNVTTSPSAFLICDQEHCFLDFLTLDPNLYLFNLSLSYLIANSTSLNICLCVVELPFYLTSTMASSSNASTIVHLQCFASNLAMDYNPTSV